LSSAKLACCQGHLVAEVDDGVGIISTIVGFLIFTVLLLVAVQVAVNLYTRSVVSAVGFDAARIVSGADAGASLGAQDAAEEQARRELGGVGARARFVWAVTPDDVALQITVPSPEFLPGPLAEALHLRSVTRGAMVRRERVR
jgi:hypothetical protein